MNRDKVSEMARVMCGREKDCLVCPIQSPCLMRNCAELLNAEGYRKASDVAREIITELEKALEQAKEIADIRIRELAPHTYKVMREVGELYHKHDSNAIAELKKKYESEDTK